jgi:hypothetical protein
MKALKSKKALILLTVLTIVITTTNPALAAFSDLVKTQKLTLLGLPPEKITSYISKGGGINFNTIFNDVSQTAYNLFKDSDVKTAGDQIADLNQNTSEISHQINTESTSQSLKYFQDNADRVQQVTTENETPSESSLEAADKANKLASTNVNTTQQLTKATLDLAVAQQNQNSIEIQKGQIARTERLRNEIDSAYGANEFERLQVVARRRFYPNAAGEMVEGKADSSTRVFNRK